MKKICYVDVGITIEDGSQFTTLWIDRDQGFGGNIHCYRGFKNNRFRLARFFEVLRLFAMRLPGAEVNK